MARTLLVLRFMVKSLLKTLGVIALAATVAAGYVYWPALVTVAHGGSFAAFTAQAPTPAAPALPKTNLQFAPAITLDLPAAIDQDLIQNSAEMAARKCMSRSQTRAASMCASTFQPA